MRSRAIGALLARDASHALTALGIAMKRSAAIRVGRALSDRGVDVRFSESNLAVAADE